MDIQTLTDDWVHQIKSAKDITKAAADAGRPPTPEEQANITKFMAAGKSLETQIQELRDAEALVKSVDAELAKFSQPAPGPLAPPVEPLDSERKRRFLSRGLRRPKNSSNRSSGEPDLPSALRSV